MKIAFFFFLFGCSLYFIFSLFYFIIIAMLHLIYFYFLFLSVLAEDRIFTITFLVNYFFFSPFTFILFYKNHERNVFGVVSFPSHSLTKIQTVIKISATFAFFICLFYLLSCLFSGSSMY